MNLLILDSHAILEYDELRMFSDLGYDVFMPGGYSDPRNPGETMRPALPGAPYHPELIALCDEQRRKHDGEEPGPRIDWAKADLHPDLIEWADVIMVNCFPDVWIGGQWDRLRGKRVIWRTIGQSDPSLEVEMRRYRAQGLEIVRYSPAERRGFEAMGAFAGGDAVIRFSKYPADWSGWTGEDAVVGNITQNMAGRGDACGLSFWLAATEGLPTRPAGPGSEALPGGIGALSYDEMRQYLRRCRAYLYTGTSPASYTLGLMEAMLTGIPIVSIDPAFMGSGMLFEGHEITSSGRGPKRAAIDLTAILDNRDLAERISRHQRQRAIDLFSVDVVGPQWIEYLGEPLMNAAQVERRLVGAAA